MATNTLIAPTDLIIETGAGATVLAVRFAEAHSAHDARMLARHLTVNRMRGIEGVDVVGDTVAVSFDPGTITRSHLELLVREACAHI